MAVMLLNNYTSKIAEFSGPGLLLTEEDSSSPFNIRVGGRGAWTGGKIVGYSDMEAGVKITLNKFRSR
jgi:hypothetical protein